ncbi:Exportin-T (Exportin(tRNA)) (tRNA exportin) [Durusdinium trenchii]|uniref:Exportin-T (Exportin(tRNA)) (tRNA exportin) n=1 Tax=Durusdinium trenchii TaxID=1381693 RepID=A0ABP0RD97_9DINO
MAPKGWKVVIHIDSESLTEVTVRVGGPPNSESAGDKASDAGPGESGVDIHVEGEDKTETKGYMGKNAQAGAVAMLDREWSMTKREDEKKEKENQKEKEKEEEEDAEENSEVKDLLKQKYHGHFMKAWRHLLDKDGSNRVNWSEFQTACQKLRYHGDVAGAWRAFDSDLSGYLTLNEIDTEASDTLCEFKDWAWNEFGTVRAAFGVFDHDGSNSLSFEEFRGNCRIYGYEGNARKLFDALDINGERSLSISEIAFLDDWDMGKAEEGEKSKTDKRKSRIRQMNESVKRHESKGRVSQKRLTELPMRLIASIRENMGDRMDELGRLQKAPGP